VACAKGEKEGGHQGGESEKLNYKAGSEKKRGPPEPLEGHPGGGEQRGEGDFHGGAKKASKKTDRGETP